MNKRRKLIIGLGAASVTPRGLFAQPKMQPVLIGWLILIDWCVQGPVEPNRFSGAQAAA